MSNLGNFQPSLTWIIFVSSSFPPLIELKWYKGLIFYSSSQVPELLYIFFSQSIFFLLFRLGYFHWSIKLKNSFFWLLLLNQSIEFYFHCCFIFISVLYISFFIIFSKNFSETIYFSFASSMFIELLETFLCWLP